MKKIASAIAMFGFAMAGTAAYAQQQPANNGGLRVRGVAAMEFTFGGDKLAEVPTYNTYTGSNSSQSVTAGGLLQFKGGVEFPLAPGWALQTTIGFHVHDTNISNGSAKFQRFPLEAIAFYQAAPQFRIGAGLRKALSPKYSESGAVGNGSVDLNSKVAFVLEGEYLFSPNFTFNVRAVSEKYNVNGYSGTIDGSHGGLGMKFYW